MALFKRPLSLFRGVCPGCGAAMEADGSLLCRWCAIRVYPDGERLIGSRRVITAFNHSGVPREMIIRLKFAGERKLAGSIAALSLSSWRSVPGKGDTIVPVPTTAVRLRKRGYNQTELIAGEVASATGAVCKNLLRRRKGESQVGLSAAERYRNIRGKFSFRGTGDTPGRTWLFDDVMTTGATILECLAVLENAGVTGTTPIVVCFRKPDDEGIIQHGEVTNGGG